MFLTLKNSSQIIWSSVRFFGKHPKVLIPLLCVWCIYAPTILWLKFEFPKQDFRYPYLILFGVVFALASLLSFSCTVVLQFIKQIETGKRLRLFTAFCGAIKNLPKALPIIFLWSFIWFALAILGAFFSRESGNSSEEFTAENAAKTLSGMDGRFSLSEAFVDALQKGVRMVVFLLMPAIVWEGCGPFGSIKRGLHVFRFSLKSFIAGYILTEGTTALIYLPALIPILLLGLFRKLGVDVNYPSGVWVMIFIYLAFAWSFSIYIEQMFCAELYIWFLKWEQAARSAKLNGKSIPRMNQVPKPDLMNSKPDLLLGRRSSSK